MAQEVTLPVATPLPQPSVAVAAAAVDSSPPAADSVDSAVAASSSDPASSSSSSASRHWRVALNVISVAKAGLKLAPVLVDGTFALAQSGTSKSLYYARRGVEAGSEAIRGGVISAGEAAANKLEALSAAAADEEQQAKYARWSENARWTSGILDRGLERGSDIVERHLLPGLNTVAQTSLSVTALTLKTSMRGTNALVSAAGVGTKYMLTRNGVDVAELEDEYEHEKMVDSLLDIINEVKRLNHHVADVPMNELVTVLMTYARLVETVESQTMFAARRQVLPEYLANITEERRKRAERKEQEEKNEAIPAPVAAASAPTQKKAGWFSSWWPVAASAPAPATPAPPPSAASSSTDDSSSSSSDPSYEDGLYALAGSGMTRASRAMLFAGCAYGPRFLRFMGLPTNARTHESFIVEQAGIRMDDLLLTDFTSSLKHPGYALIRDTKLKQILLVIRGSSALHDAIVDLTCGLSKHIHGEFGSKGYAEGSCHAGMLASAKWFAKNLKQPILDALQANPGYTFSICGHSLGGGVGSLLILLWLHDPDMNPPHRRLSGYFFGPPCIVTPELSSLGYGYIWNFVLGQDLVCRLSKGSVEDLCAVVLSLTTTQRRETELMKLTSKERKIRKAQLEQEEKVKQENQTKLHTGCTNYKELAMLLDRYHELLQLKKKLVECGPSSAPLPNVNPSATDAAAASSSSSSTSPLPPTLASLDSDLDDHLSSLYGILLHLRKSMNHEKLYQLGHIFHLLPQEETIGEEDQKEKEEMKILAKEVAQEAPNHTNTGIGHEDADGDGDAASNLKHHSHSHRSVGSVGSSSSSSSSSSKDASKDSKEANFWTSKKPIMPSARVRMATLTDLIGVKASQLPSVQQANETNQNGNQTTGVESTNTPNTTTPGTPMDLSYDSPIAVSSSSSVSSSPLPSVSPNLTPSVSASSSSKPRPTLPIAMPVPGMSVASKETPKLTKSKSASVTLPVATPVLLATSSASNAATLASTEFVENGIDETVSGSPMEIATPITSQRASPQHDINMIDGDGASSLPASAPVAMPAPAPIVVPINGAAYLPPIAPPIPKPEPVPEKTVFTHPPPFSLYCGHWSDLSDLTLSSQMIQHHSPAAYFVALATHATTREQATAKEKPTTNNTHQETKQR